MLNPNTNKWRTKAVVGPGDKAFSFVTYSQSQHEPVIYSMSCSPTDSRGFVDKCIAVFPVEPLDQIAVVEPAMVEPVARLRPGQHSTPVYVNLSPRGSGIKGFIRFKQV